MADEYEKRVDEWARVICETPEDGAVTVTRYDALGEEWKEKYRREARALMAYISAAGFALVPVEATDRMIQHAHCHSFISVKINAAIAAGDVLKGDEK